VRLFHLLCAEVEDDAGPIFPPRSKLKIQGRNRLNGPSKPQKKTVPSFYSKPLFVAPTTRLLNCNEPKPPHSSTISSWLRQRPQFRAMAATSPRRLPVAAALAVAAVLFASMAAGDDGDGVYDPCADGTVQRGDGFTFGVAFAAHNAFFSGDVQLSPCDSRLGLANRAQLSLFRPQVDEISLLTVNGSGFDPVWPSTRKPLNHS
jgi:hypothetical protein